MYNVFNGNFAVPNTKNMLKVFNASICLGDYQLGAGKAPWALNYFGAVNLQNVDLYKVEGTGAWNTSRTRRHILADSSRDFVLSIPLRERAYVLHAGRVSISEPGTFRLYSTSTPFSGYMSGAHPRDRISFLTAKVSGSMLRQLLPDIDSYPNLLLKILPGSGKIMKALVETGLAEGSALSTSQARDFGKTVINAIANAVLDAPEVEKRQAHQSSPERIRESAKDFIECNLSNPMLDCALVASHCQVSETYLHATFASSSIKVGAYIREKRLQQCRADLQNPALLHHTITEIMMNWGFADLASFGQTYKARFGKTPREERNLMTSLYN